MALPMFPITPFLQRNILLRNTILRRISTITMSDSKSNRGKRASPFAGRGRGKRPFSNATPRNAAPAISSEESAPPSRVATPPLTEAVPEDTARFVDLEGMLSPTLIKTMTEDLKFNHMMPVQAATLHDLLKNRADVLAQAKTGTGKTVAFLLPAIQTLLNKSTTGRKDKISLLVLSPTRELALQIQKEAQKILSTLR